MGFRKGKNWETICKKEIKADLSTDLCWKCINPESIDFLSLSNRDGFKVVLVESKEVKITAKKKWYYPKESKKKREQLKKYFEVKKALNSWNINCEVYIYLRKKGKEEKILKFKFDDYDDVPVRL